MILKLWFSFLFFKKLRQFSVLIGGNYVTDYSIRLFFVFVITLDKKNGDNYTKTNIYSLQDQQGVYVVLRFNSLDTIKIKKLHLREKWRNNKKKRENKPLANIYIHAWISTHTRKHAYKQKKLYVQSFMICCDFFYSLVFYKKQNDTAWVAFLFCLLFI